MKGVPAWLHPVPQTLIDLKRRQAQEMTQLVVLLAQEKARQVGEEMDGLMATIQAEYGADVRGFQEKQQELRVLQRQSVVDRARRVRNRAISDDRLKRYLERGRARGRKVE